MPLGESVRDKSERERNLCLPPLYLDSCTLIQGEIESIPEVQRNPNWRMPNETDENIRKRIDEIDAAKRIITKWNPSKLYISTFTLLETIDTATRKYNMPINQILSILTYSLTNNYTILFPEIEIGIKSHKIIKELETVIPDKTNYYLEKIKLSGEKDGITGDIVKFATTTSGCVSSVAEYGSPELVGADYSVTGVNQHSISSPKYERELILGAAQIVVDLGVHATDAIHLLMLRKMDVVFVTTDRTLRSKLEPKKEDFPICLVPTEVISRFDKFF